MGETQFSAVSLEFGVPGALASAWFAGGCRLPNHTVHMREPSHLLHKITSFVAVLSGIFFIIIIVPSAWDFSPQ